MTLEEIWPAAGLRARAGDLELRWIDDDLLARLADLASRGIHDPGAMPFYQPWTRGTPLEVARSVVTYQWQVRGAVGPSQLVLELGALVAGVPVGIQGASGGDWSVLGEVETGSWLGREHQGKGIGTRMRALMLELLFDGLGAQVVRSGAFADNPASNAVSERVGYLPDGVARLVREGAAVEQRRWVMTRERFAQVREANRALLGGPVALEGVESVRAILSA